MIAQGVQTAPGRLRHEADYSPPSSAEVNNGRAPPYVFMAWCLINLAQGQIYLFCLLFLYSRHVNMVAINYNNREKHKTGENMQWLG
jgi:hypothetical protein